MGQVCNSNYWGDQDREDCGSRPTGAKFYETLSEPVAGHNGACLSSLLYQEVQTGGLRPRPAKAKNEILS
jgi:hypothetical protein